MTQAFNLSQLANNLNSAGQLDATDGLVNAVPVANGGTGASTAAAARTNLGVAAAVYSVPTGGIILWSGAQAAIPSGWVLCDGANGTPDLRSRFVIGAGGTYGVGSTGGSADAIVVSHTHTFSTTTSSDGEHTHEPGASGTTSGYSTAKPPTPYLVSRAQTDGGPYHSIFTTSNGAHTHSVSGTTASSGASGTGANLPPYYALCYIMKT